SGARLAGFKKLLTHISTDILPDVGFELWDRSVVPDGLSPDAPILVIADEGVVAALVRRPSMHTFLSLWVTSRIDLRNGTAYDLPQAAPATRRAIARYWLRLGRAGLSRRQTLWRSRSWRDAGGGAIRLRKGKSAAVGT